MLSLIAEPLAGVVDTAFVERLGASYAAALGAGTAVLSGVVWVFNFLGIGTQTEVARAAGEARARDAGEVASLAIVLVIESMACDDIRAYRSFLRSPRSRRDGRSPMFEFIG